MSSAEEGYVPSHPDLFIVNFKPGGFLSSLVAQKSFVSGEVIARLEGLTAGPKAYTSVQYGPGPNDHVELNSDLVYVNHSCEPNVAFDMSSSDRSEWNVRALKPVDEGDALTFFYPSTEWSMEQTFDCFCSAPTCLKRVGGAASLSREDLLAREYVSPWILASIAKRDSTQ
ncbi:hypothetical protein OF83DRAFT_1140952 [Amylostereum chailletii]|nr:hypothetical protein OF83DRAFT_1140952 [Amylostereum chailletii]